MTCSFVVYIDESGDEGFSFQSGSSEWFVLSAVVTLKAEDLETVRLVDRVRQTLRRPVHKPLHFRDLRHEHRLPLLAEISRAPLRVITLLVHKPSILGSEVPHRGDGLYFLAVDSILEGVSLLCQNAKPRVGDGSAEVIFSSRSGLSLESLRDSIYKLTQRLEGAHVRHDQIYTYTAGRRMGLQIADAVASGFLKAVEHSEYGHTEDRYARMLGPVIYKKEGICKGYSLRVWPPQVEYSLKNERRFDWIREAFEEEN